MNTPDQIKTAEQRKRSQWLSALWPKSLLGRIVRVFLVMAVWLIVPSVWSRQTVLSLWRHGGSAYVMWPEPDAQLPEWIGELQYNWSQLVVDPAVEWLSDHWEVSDWVLAGDGGVESVDLSQTDIDHTWLPQLRRCINLEGIALKSSQLGPEVAALKNLSKLQRVTIDEDDDQIDVRPLASLPHLQRLNIYSIKRPIVGAESLSLDCKVTVSVEQLDDWVTILDSLANAPRIELSLHEIREIPVELYHRISSMVNVTSVSFQSGAPSIADLRTILGNDSLKTISVSEATEQWVDDLIDDDQIVLILKNHPTLKKLEISDYSPRTMWCFTAPPASTMIAPKTFVSFSSNDRMRRFSPADALLPEHQFPSDVSDP